MLREVLRKAGTSIEPEKRANDAALPGAAAVLGCVHIGCMASLQTAKHASMPRLPQNGSATQGESRKPELPPDTASHLFPLWDNCHLAKHTL